MKRFTLLLTVVLLSFSAFGQSHMMDTETLEKLQQIEQAEREATKSETDQPITFSFIKGAPSYAKAIDCPEDATYTNPPVDFTSGVTSNTDIGYLSAQKIENFDNPIQAIRFYGIQGINPGAGWQPMNDVDPFGFEIKFFEDNGGLPGTLISSIDATLNHVNTNEIFANDFNVYHWDFIPTSPVDDLPSTFWVGIANTNTDAWFLWLDQPGGPGAAAQSDAGVWELTEYDSFGICLVPVLAEDDAPSAPADFTVSAGAMGALSADLAWTNPALTFGGETLTELDEINITRNGEVIHTITDPVIGAAATYTDNTVSSAGIYSYGVFGVNTTGDGPAVSASVYIGEDVPAAPSDFELVADGNDGLLTWTAPTEGLNGGYLSGDNLTYTIVRMPDDVEVATDVTGTQFLDTTVPGIGNYFYIITVSNDIGEGGIAASNVALLAADGILLYETFDYEAGTLPPGWEITGEVTHAWAVNNSSSAGGQAPELRMNWTPAAVGMSRLVTYPINTNGQEELRFKFNQYLNNFSTNEGEIAAIDVSFDGGETWEAAWEIEITADIPAGEYEIFIDVPAGKNTMHLGFRFDGDSYNINQWYFDNLILEPVLENDLVAVSISGNTTPSEGITSTYTVAVQNAGTITQTNYSVKLMQEGGVEIASVDGTAIEFGETLTFDLEWTPDVEGPTYLYGYVDFAADEAPGNNQTPNLNINVQSSDMVVVTIGEGTNYPPSRIPFDFFFKNSLSQTLYYPEEIGMGGGVITGIGYVSNFTTNLPDKEIQIWIGETELDNLADGWVDPESLILVYDGTADFPTGENDIYLAFNQPYVYGGGNLVVYTHRIWEDEYFASTDRFYGTEDPGSSRTRRASADGTVYDPAEPATGNAIHWHPNTSIYFSTAGLGALAGNVTDGTDALEDVKVSILGTPISTVTDADGDYEFPYLLPETYNVELSKFGYETVVLEGVVIEEDETTIADAVLVALQQFTVSGIVEGNDGVLQEDAMVTLVGYDNYSVVTNADGEFTIEDVYEGTYTLTVAAMGYEVFTDDNVVVDADLDLGTIEVIEIIVTPGGLAVDTDGQEEGNALFTWSDASTREFRFDDGVADAQLGFTNGTLNGVMGSAHRNDAVLYEMSWFLTSEGGPHNNVKLWVVGLNENGMPNSSDILFEQANVPSVDNQWNTFEFPTPIEAPNGFLLGMSYQGFLGLAIDDGAGDEWPFQPNTHFYIADISGTGSWSTVESVDFTGNFMIRAFGEDNGEIPFKGEMMADGNTGTEILTGSQLGESVKTGFPVYNNHNALSATRAFVGYNVFLDDLTDPVAEEITANEYLFTNLDEGAYTAGVQSVYTTGTSEIVTIDFDMVYGVEVIVDVTTNSGDSPEGAVVTLTNEDFEQYEYTGTADADGEIVFDAVRKGVYTVHVTLPLHHVYTASGIDIQDDFTYTAELIEIIEEPYGLMVDTENVGEGEALFSWNNAMGWAESFEEGSMPEGWSQIITNTGSGTVGDYTWQITGEVTFSEGGITPQDGDYQAFIMWDFGHQDEWLITPEFTAPADNLVFWYYGTNGSPNGDNYYVKVSADGGDTWEILWNASDLPEGQNHYEVPAVVDLSAYAGQDIHIAWNNVDGDGQGLWYAWAIDNISVGDMKIDVRDLMHVSAGETAVGHNYAAKDGLFRPTVNPEDMLSEVKEREFMGFNVFLNEDSASIGTMGTSYLFTDVPPGTHVAGVQSVYSSGLSDIITIEFVMEAPDEQFARAQIIHNSADETVSSVDIYVNGEIFLADIGFRQATAFMDVPAAVDLEIHIAPAGSGIENAVGPFDLNLTPYETYVIVASGIVGETDDPVTAFDLFIYDQGREAAQNVANTDVMVFHGVTDAPAVTIFEQTIDNALILVEYGEFSDYLPLPAQDYIFEIRDADGVELIAAFEAPLASMGYESEAIVIVASGFLNSGDNNTTFGLWLAEVEGGDLIELDIFVNVDEMTMFDNNINMFPNPANNVVNLQSTSVMSEIRMIDMSGRVVYSENIDSDRHQFDAGQFNNGIYIIQVVTTEGIFMDKLQIQR